MAYKTYKVGDKVRVPMFNEAGTIVDIDLDWIYPYEIVFDSGRKYDKELFEINEFYPLLKDVSDNGGLSAEVNTTVDKEEYINIKFQEGAIQENGVNGCQIEDVIDMLVERLKGFQNGYLPCRENEMAINHLEEAQNWLYRRRIKREEQGVEGTNGKHE